MPLVVKNPPANAGDVRDADSIPGLGRSPGVGNVNLLQYSCLENTTDRGTWWALTIGSHRTGHNWSDLAHCSRHRYVMYSKVKVDGAQSCPTLCDPVDCSLPGSSVHGIFQARVLEWVAISFSRRSSQPRDRTQVSCVVGRFFTVSAIGKTWAFLFCFV